MSTLPRLEFTCFIYGNANNLFFSHELLWGNMTGTEVWIFVFVFACSQTSFMIWNHNDRGGQRLSHWRKKVLGPIYRKRATVINTHKNINGTCSIAGFGGILSDIWLQTHEKKILVASKMLATPEPHLAAS